MIFLSPRPLGRIRSSLCAASPRDFHLRSAQVRRGISGRLLFVTLSPSDPPGRGGVTIRQPVNAARAFGESFVPVPKRVLDAPCDLLELERAVGEDPDIKYWAPRSLGEIFYNYWD